MKRCVVFWWCFWCVAPSVLGYPGAQISAEKGAKQRVQALLDHRPIPSFRSGGVVHQVDEEKESAVSTQLPRPPRLTPSSAQRNYADTVRLLYSARDAKIREPRLTPTLSQELEDVRSANEHFLRIRTTARCRVPRTRVVHVKEFYSDPSKEYLPRCTVLHRCGDDSGCCDNEQYECVPRTMQEVTLHFYTIHLQNQNGEVGLRNSVTKLLFTNHTECECQPINDIPRTAPRPPKFAASSRDPSNRLPVSLPIHPPSSDDSELVSGSGMHEEIPGAPLKCHNCPEPFTRRSYDDGRCSCDCFEKQKPCLKIKRGRDALGDLQRRCVETQECHVPECEYGLYDVETGRCPKRPDYWPKHAEQRKVHPHSHRWQFFERD